MHWFRNLPFCSTKSTPSAAKDRIYKIQLCYMTRANQMEDTYWCRVVIIEDFQHLLPSLEINNFLIDNFRIEARLQVINSSEVLAESDPNNYQLCLKETISMTHEIRQWLVSGAAQWRRWRQTCIRTLMRCASLYSLQQSSKAPESRRFRGGQAILRTHKALLTRIGVGPRRQISSVRSRWTALRSTRSNALVNNSNRYETTAARELSLFSTLSRRSFLSRSGTPTSIVIHRNRYGAYRPARSESFVSPASPVKARGIEEAWLVVKALKRHQIRMILRGRAISIAQHALQATSMVLMSRLVSTMVMFRRILSMQSLPRKTPNEPVTTSLLIVTTQSTCRRLSISTTTVNWALIINWCTMAIFTRWTQLL